MEPRFLTNEIFYFKYKMSEKKNSVVNFCPKCHTLLTFQYDPPTGEDRSLKLKCDNCLEMTDAPKDIRVIRSHQDHKSADLNPEMFHDKTLMCTKRLRCTNASCNSYDPMNWDKYDPELKMISFNDQDRKMSLLCQHCKSVYSLVPV